MFRKTLLWLTLISLQTLTYSTHAASDDRKSYPGSFCVEVGDTTPEAYYDSLSRLRNNAEGTNTFVCGAILDHGAAKDISVSVLDEHPSNSVTCIGQTRSENGNLGAWTQNVSSLNGTSTLFLGSLNNQPSRGYHFIRCSVPGKVNGRRSGINSYYIRERD